MEKLCKKLKKNLQTICGKNWGKNRGKKYRKNCEKNCAKFMEKSWRKIVEFFLLSQLKEYTLAIEIPPPIVPPSNKYRSLRTPLITVGTQPKPRDP